MGIYDYINGLLCKYICIMYISFYKRVSLLVVSFSYKVIDFQIFHMFECFMFGSSSLVSRLYTNWFAFSGCIIASSYQISIKLHTTTIYNDFNSFINFFSNALGCEDFYRNLAYKRHLKLRDFFSYYAIVRCSC